MCSRTRRGGRSRRRAASSTTQCAATSTGASWSDTSGSSVLLSVRLCCLWRLCVSPRASLAVSTLGLVVRLSLALPGLVHVAAGVVACAAVCCCWVIPSGLAADCHCLDGGACVGVAAGVAAARVHGLRSDLHWRFPGCCIWQLRAFALMSRPHTVWGAAHLATAGLASG